MSDAQIDNTNNQELPIAASDSLMQQLRQEARVITTARMLPMNEKLSEEEIVAVRQSYLAYIAKHGITLAVVAKQADCGESVISQWGRGIYNGDNDEITRRINGWLQRDGEQRRAALKDGYVRTELAEDMRGIIKAACAHIMMAVIVVPSGCGKTLVLEMMSISKSYNGYYVYCDEDLTPKAFMAKLCAVLKIHDSSQSKYGMKAKIIETLRGTGRPLYLDEAHLIPKECFSRIRSVFDQAKIPIILAGTDEILNRVDDRANGRGQFSRRCLRYNAMDHVWSGESNDGNRKGRPLFSRLEVKNFLEKIEVRVAPDAFDMLWSLACLPGSGGFGNLIEIFKFKNLRGCTASRDAIKDTMSIMGGTHSAYLAKTAERNIEGLRKLA